LLRQTEAKNQNTKGKKQKTKREGRYCVSCFFALLPFLSAFNQLLSLDFKNVENSSRTKFMELQQSIDALHDTQKVVGKCDGFDRFFFYLFVDIFDNSLPLSPEGLFENYLSVAFVDSDWSKVRER
jgi:hypothetical protein